ncbi:MAG TPA: alkane 1-monooxygenase [Casimicrobiaceae bacterium]|nr:alkane 1-monooxygenase [Casimicrobiaceae bacterium]
MELASRVTAVMLLPMLTLVCITTHIRGVIMLIGWMLLSLIVDIISRRISPPPAWPPAIATALCVIAPLAHMAVLIYALWVLPTWSTGVLATAGIMVLVGVSGGTTGITAAHELIHRRSVVPRKLGELFMLAVTYPHFPIVHLRVHHPYIGTAIDPGTSRLNEPLLRYLWRAYGLSWRSSWRLERSRLERAGSGVWSWQNAILRAALWQCLVYAGLLLVFGAVGVGLFFVQSIVAVSLSLSIDYTQHYGVVRREIAPGRLERVQAHHAWSSDHASNRSMFNVGFHANHHLLPALPYLHLHSVEGALDTPYGYPGLLLLAMVPRLWFRTMNPRLDAARGRIE